MNPVSLLPHLIKYHKNPHKTEADDANILTVLNMENTIL